MTIMKILFLDVDGVLNTRNGSLDADKLDLLMEITQATGAHVCISSTWRHHEHQMARLRPELARRRIVIAGQTPDASHRTGSGLYVASTRGDEIAAWLADQPEVGRFLIVDDADFTTLKGWLVKTETHVGLTRAHADEIIRRLR